MAYRLAHALEKLRSQVDAAAPHRSKASDGWIGDSAHFATGSASDHNPWISFGGIGIVTAIDITHDPAHGCDVWEIAQAIAASKDRRLKYLIYTGGVGGKPGILSQTVSPWVWRTRSVDDHPHHLHISVNTNSRDFDSTAAWSLSRYVKPPVQPPAVPTELEQLMAITVNNPITNAETPLDVALWSIWTYSFKSYQLNVELMKIAGVDVDEAALAKSLLEGLSGPIRQAVVEAIAAAPTESTSPEAIADAVVEKFAAALAAKPPIVNA